MLANLFDKKYVEIDLSLEEGSLFGYVVDSKECNLSNWLEEINQLDSLNMIRTTYERVALFKNIWVEDDERGKGIGTSLLSDGLHEAELNGAQAVLLEADTLENNKFDLVKWYEDFGFETISDRYNPLMLKAID